MIIYTSHIMIQHAYKAIQIPHQAKMTQVGLSNINSKDLDKMHPRVPDNDFYILELVATVSIFPCKN